MNTDKSIKNVQYVGPGFWTSIHGLAAACQTKKDVDNFIAYMEWLRENFPCDTCKPHIGKFLDTHPYGNFAGEKLNGKEVGYFRMTNLMHNKVNSRLGKRHVPFEEAYDMFYNNEGCMDICPGVISEETTTRKVGGRRREKFNKLKI